jgi:Domain of unknown function (DUF397)
VTAAVWREFERATALINRVRDYGLVHPDATVEDVLTALEEPATADNTLYAGTGLFMAVQAQERAARAGLAQVPLGEEMKPDEKEGSTMDFDPDELKWFKSSYSAAGACVEVAYLPDGAGVALRDSKTPSRQPHFFARDEWGAFIDGAKTGEFDLP